MAKRKKQENKFFLRFYDQTNENIDRCIQELRDLGHEFISVEKGSMTTSVNFVVPDNSIEVLIGFATEGELLAFSHDTRTGEVYTKYGTGSKLPPAKLIRRKPGDSAFSV